MPKIGNRNNKKTRYNVPGGFKKVTIQNEKELELLLMNNRRFCAEISQKVSAKKRYLILPYPLSELHSFRRPVR